MVGKKKLEKTTKAQIVKSVDDLKVELAKKQQDLLEAKKGHRQGELVNTCVLRSTRKEIARLKTLIRTDQLLKEKENK